MSRCLFVVKELLLKFLIDFSYFLSIFYLFYMLSRLDTAVGGKFILFVKILMKDYNKRLI